MEVRVLQTQDTAERLAAIYYGSWPLFHLIVDANPHVDFDNVGSGIRIQIPEPLTLEKNHTIEIGDSYLSLADKYYGTEHFSFLIAKENSRIILHENIGETIVVPRLVSKELLQRIREARP